MLSNTPSSDEWGQAKCHNSQPAEPKTALEPAISAAAVGDEANIDSDEDAGKPEAVDGGLKAWSVVCGAWCVSFCSYGWINSE